MMNVYKVDGTGGSTSMARLGCLNTSLRRHRPTRSRLSIRRLPPMVIFPPMKPTILEKKQTNSQPANKSWSIGFIVATFLRPPRLVSIRKGSF